MGNHKSKHAANRYHSLSAQNSETESVSGAVSVTSNPVVAKRLSQANFPPMVAGKVPRCFESPTGRESVRGMDDYFSVSEQRLFDDGNVLRNTTVVSTTRTINSPVPISRLQVALPLADKFYRGKESRRRLCHEGVCLPPVLPTTKPAVYATETSTQLPYHAHPSSRGHRVERIRETMAPENEQHLWAWKLFAVDSTGRISDQDVRQLNRKIGDVVRPVLAEQLSPYEGYKIEVRIVKEGIDHCGRPSRPELFRPTYCSPRRIHMNPESRQKRKSANPQYDKKRLAWLVAQNHERNNVFASPPKIEHDPHYEVVPRKHQRSRRQHDTNVVVERPQPVKTRSPPVVC